MEWKLFANLAETVGRKEVAADVEPGATFGEALDALLEEHPELRGEVLDEDGELREHIRVLHNGDNPFVEGDGYGTELSAGDELALFPPVSGGSVIGRSGRPRRRNPGPRRPRRRRRRRR